MKKISVFLAFMLTFLFSACSSSMFDKLVEAYESSPKNSLLHPATTTVTEYMTS